MTQSNGKMTKTRLLWISLGLLFILSCNLVNPAPAPTSDLFATLQASTPLDGGAPAATQPVASPVFNAFTPVPSSTSLAVPGSVPTSIPPPSAGDQPTGRIVFTCQVFKVQAMDQVCIMNADGSGFRRLTTADNVRHFYPSLAPNGQSVLYVSFREQNVYEVYKLDLNDGSVDRLTNRLGVLTAPEYSPNGERITFTRGNPSTGRYQVFLMDANGDDAGNIPQVEGWDPTWSPDGKQILYASSRSGLNQLHTVNINNGRTQQITNLPSIRGRSDWSTDGGFIVTYSGEPWHREVYIMSADGSNVRQLTPSGGNSQGPSFSPDGKWVAFTAYFDNYGDDHGCEIYIIRTDGTDLRRLTNNDYCDYQPRWGP